MKAIDRLKLYLDRIDEYNPRLNAFLHLDRKAAHEGARASDQRKEDGHQLSLIEGFCVAVKANIAVRGMPFHAGIEAYKDRLATEDARCVKRLRDAGAVVLGVVNMHEGALGATTDNACFGRTYNPWGVSLTPGGSSGGSGASIAAGLCDIALGTDTMGSVRIPSAYCGIQGFKPTYGTVPTDGLIDLSPSLDHVGPHARSVETLHHAFDVLCGNSRQSDQLDPSPRIGIWLGSEQIDVHSSVEQSVHYVTQLLRDAGYEITYVSPQNYAYGRTRRAGLLISEVEGFDQHREVLRASSQGFTEGFRSMLEWGERQSDEKNAAAFAHLDSIRSSEDSVFRSVDFLIAPTAPQPAFRFDEAVPENQADFTAWANFAGLPACAIYSGMSDEGLPLSVQIIGRRGADANVLKVAAALEKLIGSPPVPPGYEGVLPGN
ncbi:MAG: amidase [Pseudomonadota bacterium]